MRRSAKSGLRARYDGVARHAQSSPGTSASETTIARIIGETRKYIRDFERLVMQTTTARELYDEMLKLYPDWINRGALWSSALAVKTLM